VYAPTKAMGKGSSRKKAPRGNRLETSDRINFFRYSQWCGLLADGTCSWLAGFAQQTDGA
jgi:hypothetical protein